jgi:hypothetical protein
MGHIAPVARWFGFGFGFTVAGAVALVTIARVSDRVTVLAVVDAMAMSLVALAWAALVRSLFNIWRENRPRPAGPLGTYAKSDSQKGGGAEGPADQWLSSQHYGESAYGPFRTPNRLWRPVHCAGDF